MSEENVEVVRKAVNAANAFMRGELSGEAFAEIGVVDPQLKFSWHDERTMPDLPQHLDSAPEGIKLLEQLRSAWADLPWEALEYIEAPGDRIVTLLRQSFRGRESGLPMVAHYFQLWTIQGGKVAKIEIFRHRAAALEAAGLSG
jgi:ketosteroid isomerase-like protein